MDLFCPVEGCEGHPVKILDVRVYTSKGPWPEAFVCDDHYEEIMAEPKEWRFSNSWDKGLLIQRRVTRIRK